MLFYSPLSFTLLHKQNISTFFLFTLPLWLVDYDEIYKSQTTPCLFFLDIDSIFSFILVQQQILRIYSQIVGINKPKPIQFNKKKWFWKSFIFSILLLYSRYFIIMYKIVHVSKLWQRWRVKVVTSSYFIYIVRIPTFFLRKCKSKEDYCVYLVFFLVFHFICARN